MHTVLITLAALYGVYRYEHRARFAAYRASRKQVAR